MSELRKDLTLEEMGARVRAASLAKTCLCGKATGHAGWLLCIFPSSNADRRLP